MIDDAPVRWIGFGPSQPETPVAPDVKIYFIRKKGTTDQYYRRRGGGRYTSGPKRGKRRSMWGTMAEAACWTCPAGPNPVKGENDVIPFTLGEEVT